MRPNAAGLDGIEELLARGQRDGEFREFPPRTVALIIRQLLSGAPQYLLTEQDLDPGRPHPRTGDRVRARVRTERNPDA